MGDSQRDLERMTVPQLRSFLTERGIPCHGKRKHELESLVKKAAGTYRVIEPCDREESGKKCRRVTAVDGSLRDLNDKLVTWKTDLRALPTITYMCRCSCVFDCGL